VTEPIQIFLVAAGAAMLVDPLRRISRTLVSGGLSAAVGKRTESKVPEEASHPIAGLSSFAALCIFLVLPLPLIAKITGFVHTLPDKPAVFLPGSFLLVSREGADRSGFLPRSVYLDRLADFQECYPDNSRFFLSEPADFFLAINWRNLENVVFPANADPSF
jgi:hypothetical protein